MKSPDKTLPQETAMAFGMPQPTQEIGQQAISNMELEETAPKLAPPARAAQEGTTAVGAAVWQTDKRVSGLYTTYHPRNSWMYITGIGWKRLATANDSTQEAMNLLASHCREKSCRIDYSEDGGLVNEIYVW